MTEIQIDDLHALVGAHRIAYQCPTCDKDWLAPVTVMELAALSNVAGDRALTARLEALKVNPPVATCPACVIQYGTPNAQNGA